MDSHLFRSIRGGNRGAGGGRGVRAHPGTLPGPAGEEATAGVLPGTDQECLGRGPVERGKVVGVHPWHGDEGRHWELLHWGFCQRQGGHSCSGSPPASETPLAWCNRRCRKPSYRPSYRAWEREHQGEGSHAYLCNRRYWPSLIRQRRLLRTRRRPVSSHDTSSQRSGARRSSRWRTTRPASKREGQRCRIRAPCWRRRPWRRP